MSERAAQKPMAGNAVSYGQMNGALRTPAMGGRRGTGSGGVARDMLGGLGGNAAFQSMLRQRLAGAGGYGGMSTMHPGQQYGAGMRPTFEAPGGFAPGRPSAAGLPLNAGSGRDSMKGVLDRNGQWTWDTGDPWGG
jgi:hypothetical protein